jgi:hypothetical protein
MLLPRGNPAAVRNAGQGVPNRACATDWPPGDNRIASRARVNGDGARNRKREARRLVTRDELASSRANLSYVDLTIFSISAKRRLNIALLGFDCFYNAA